MLDDDSECSLNCTRVSCECSNCSGCTDCLGFLSTPSPSSPRGTSSPTSSVASMSRCDMPADAPFPHIDTPLCAFSSAVACTAHRLAFPPKPFILQPQSPLLGPIPVVSQPRRADTAAPVACDALTAGTITSRPSSAGSDCQTDADRDGEGGDSEHDATSRASSRSRDSKSVSMTTVSHDGHDERSRASACGRVRHMRRTPSTVAAAGATADVVRPLRSMPGMLIATLGGVSDGDDAASRAVVDLLRSLDAPSAAETGLPSVFSYDPLPFVVGCPPVDVRSITQRKLLRQLTHPPPSALLEEPQALCGMRGEPSGPAAPPAAAGVAVEPKSRARGASGRSVSSGSEDADVSPLAAKGSSPEGKKANVGDAAERVRAHSPRSSRSLSASPSVASRSHHSHRAHHSSHSRHRHAPSVSPTAVEGSHAPKSVLRSALKAPKALAASAVRVACPEADALAPPLPLRECLQQLWQAECLGGVPPHVVLPHMRSRWRARSRSASRARSTDVPAAAADWNPSASSPSTRRASASGAASAHNAPPWGSATPPVLRNRRSGANQRSVTAVNQCALRYTEALGVVSLRRKAGAAHARQRARASRGGGRTTNLDQRGFSGEFLSESGAGPQLISPGHASQSRNTQSVTLNPYGDAIPPTHYFLDNSCAVPIACPVEGAACRSITARYDNTSRKQLT